MLPGLPDKEPDSIVAGDTLQWMRYFPDYMPADGWFLDYEIRGNNQQIGFQSTPNGENHQIIVAAALTANWAASTATIMVGYAQNNAGGQFAPQFQIGNVYPQNSVVQQGGMLYQASVALIGSAGNTPPNGAYWTVYAPPPLRFQIYYQALPIRRNIEAAPGTIDTRTHAQKMVEMLEGLMTQTTGDNLLESRIGDTLFKYESQAEIIEVWGKWKALRRTEVRKQRAKNGKPSESRLIPRAAITPPGPYFGQQWPYGGYAGGNG